jgi:hypothetical protein
MITLHNEGLRDLYPLPNIIKVIKLMTVGWAGHVARMERRELYAGYVYVGNSQ